MNDNNKWSTSAVLKLGYFLLVFLRLAEVLSASSESSSFGLSLGGDNSGSSDGVVFADDSIFGGSSDGVGGDSDTGGSEQSQSSLESSSGNGNGPATDFDLDNAPRDAGEGLAFDSSETRAHVSEEISSDFSLEPKVSRSSGVEMVITRSAEISMMSLFPSLEDAAELTVSDLNKYPSVGLRDEKVMQEEIPLMVEYYKVNVPAINDYVGGLGTSDPRVEIGVRSGFEMFVNEYQPRFERVLGFLNANLNNLTSEEKIQLAVSLFPVVTFSECRKVIRNIKNMSVDLEICTLISREDVLTIQPEDLPKNVLKEKDEVYQLRGILLSLPFPLLTNASSLKWRHSRNSLGIYQAYSGGALDGFAHFDFLSKKLHDMISFLYAPVYQFWDDTRIELYNGMRSLRTVLVEDNSKKVKKLMSKLVSFHINWFGGQKAEKPCSQEFYQAYTALTPVYEGIKEIKLTLLQIKYGLDSGTLSESEFGGIITRKLLQRENIVVERRVITNAISPLFVSIYTGFKDGRITKLRREILRILAILEEIDFNSSVVQESQNSLKKCYESGNTGSYFRSDLYTTKRVFYKLVKIARQTKPEFPYPSISSTLYIKGNKFGIKNLFRKRSSRIKHGYYHEINPFDANRSSRKNKQ